jgi:hypothetical protein
MVDHLGFRKRIGIVNPTAESRHYLYVLRLVALLLIIAGIVDKNRSARRR